MRNFYHGGYHLPVIFFFLFSLFLLGVETVSGSGSEVIRDFVAFNVLPDGEVETRVFYKGVSGREITVADRGITFRQLAPSKSTLIQLIYNHAVNVSNEDQLELKDCEILHRQKGEVKKFLAKFKSDLSHIVNDYNHDRQQNETTSLYPYNNPDSSTTIQSMDNRSLPEDILSWFNYRKLRDSCRSLHKKTKAQLARQRGVKTKRSIFIVPGTLWCGHSDSASTYAHLGVMSRTDRCCRRHDHCRLAIPGFTKKFRHYNHSPFTLSHCRCDFRSKRDISDLLRIPGTKWCGKGYSADKYTRLGGFSRTDKCCRRHDMSCPFWIGGFDHKYGIFNWRVNTLMHCSCDERACLKMVDSSDANLVGKLFFNVVQSQCFVLKPRKRCTKYSWWSKCEKVKYEKQAILRDNLPY